MVCFFCVFIIFSHSAAAFDKVAKVPRRSSYTRFDSIAFDSRPITESMNKQLCYKRKNLSESNYRVSQKNWATSLDAEEEKQRRNLRRKILTRNLDVTKCKPIFVSSFQVNCVHCSVALCDWPENSLPKRPKSRLHRKRDDDDEIKLLLFGS